jgi:tRNA(Arg) A34 adenosine deaminase TadA
MSQPEMKRRDFLAGTVGVVGGAGVVGCSTLRPALAETPPVPVLDAEAPLARYWEKPVFEVATVDLNTAAPELRAESVKERHRIYCILLMKVIERFWNGNKRGPFGDYPRRVKQLEAREPTARYRGDMIAEPDRFRINWDRYLGHNIACLAVDGNGEVIDFDFNHNDFFRSSAEHAESRMVRRLFSLTDIHQHWKTGEPIPGRSRAFSLKDVTLYTSLESCAQCSGVMSLGRVKQVVYLQSDPGTYVIGNIMYNLAGVEGGDGSSLAPLPIPGAAVGLPHIARLNEGSRRSSRTCRRPRSCGTRDGRSSSRRTRGASTSSRRSPPSCAPTRRWRSSATAGPCWTACRSRSPTRSIRAARRAGRTGSASTRRAGSSSTRTSRDFGGRPTSCRVLCGSWSGQGQKTCLKAAYVLQGTLQHACLSRGRATRWATALVGV